MSEEDRPIYVIDTNILVDYVDVIPGGEGNQPLEPTIDLSEAHLIVPTVVIRELSNFKGEKYDRGKAARTVLRRLRDLFEDDELHTLAEIYNLQAPITVRSSTGKNPDTEQLISILPVHKDFRGCLPFHPSDEEMDGQIVLTAMAASMAERRLAVNGQELAGHVMGLSFDNVVLLTNDNGLAIRARERGIKTSRYGYKQPVPYTGRREVVVPNELFAEFYNSEDHILPRTLFEEMMVDEPGLVANEFIVMRLEDPYSPPSGYKPFDDPFFDGVGRYDQELDAIVRLRHVRDFPVRARNIGQAIYAEALLDPEIAAVICRGPAGSGKTFMATVFGYLACKAGSFIGVTVVPCENRSDIGALPGDLDDKMDPDVQPLKNALRNYLIHNDPNLKKKLKDLRMHGAESKGRASLKTSLNDQVNLIWNNWFSNVPIDSARGRDFAFELAIYDEFQDQNATQADTLIKRIGTDGKIVLTGDIEQIHAPYLDRENNGLVYASRQLFDNPMVAQVCFTEDEVVRHPLVQEIAKRQKEKSLQLAQT